MSFGGLGGIAGGIYVQAASIHPAGRYVAVGPSGQPDLIVPANNIFWRKSGPGSTPPGIEDANQGALQYLSIASIGPEPDPTFLEVCDDVAGNDLGTLTTERPSLATLGMHSLPENFGRGSGRWRPGDEDFINMWFRLPKICQLVTGEILAPDVVKVTFEPNTVAPLSDPQSVLGNLRILVQNRGLVPIPAGGGFPSPPIMNIEFVHTIQR